MQFAYFNLLLLQIIDFSKAKISVLVQITQLFLMHCHPFSCKNVDFLKKDTVDHLLNILVLIENEQNQKNACIEEYSVSRPQLHQYFLQEVGDIMNVYVLFFPFFFFLNEFIKRKRSTGLLIICNPDTHKGMCIQALFIDFPEDQKFCMMTVLIDLFIPK